MYFLSAKIGIEKSKHTDGASGLVWNIGRGPTLPLAWKMDIRILVRPKGMTRIYLSFFLTMKNPAAAGNLRFREKVQVSLGGLDQDESQWPSLRACVMEVARAFLKAS